CYFLSFSFFFFFFSSRRRHTRSYGDWSSDVCSSDLGRGCFSDYYTANYGGVIFQRSLRDNVIFAQHSLVTDGSFNEFHVVLCRNVMIYFNETLSERVHRLLYESLILHGILGLGDRESI